MSGLSAATEMGLGKAFSSNLRTVRSGMQSVTNGATMRDLMTFRKGIGTAAKVGAGFMGVSAAANLFDQQSTMVSGVALPAATAYALYRGSGFKSLRGIGPKGAGRFSSAGARGGMAMGEMLAEFGAKGGSSGSRGGMAMGEMLAEAVTQLPPAIKKPLSTAATKIMEGNRMKIIRARRRFGV